MKLDFTFVYTIHFLLFKLKIKTSNYIQVLGKNSVKKTG